MGWTKIHKVKEIANEYYEPLGSHDSWVRVLWDFVMKEDIGPVSRVGREMSDFVKGRATIKSERINSEMKGDEKTRLRKGQDSAVSLVESL